MRTKLVVIFVIFNLFLCSVRAEVEASPKPTTTEDDVKVVKVNVDPKWQWDDSLLGSFGIDSGDSDDAWMPTADEVLQVFGPGDENIEPAWNEQEARREDVAHEHFEHLHQLAQRTKSSHDDFHAEDEGVVLRQAFSDPELTRSNVTESINKFTGDQNEKYPPDYINRLKLTKWVNEDEVLEGLRIRWVLPPPTPLTFKLRNPYWPPTTLPPGKGRGPEPLLKWFETYEQNKSVCALKWVDDNKFEYVLKTWPSRAEAEENGYIVTHDKGCGGCSGLNDLAVYLGTRDLTKPSRTCSRRPMMSLTKVCLEHEIGFSKRCAEAWAYTIGNTKLFCSWTCIKDYGFANVILNHLSQFPDNLPNGELRPCIECDEQASGPGFKYGSGRTRRNSGIESNIKRDPGEVSNIDHWAYFK